MRATRRRGVAYGGCVGRGSAVLSGRSYPSERAAGPSKRLYPWAARGGRATDRNASERAGALNSGCFGSAPARHNAYSRLLGQLRSYEDGSDGFIRRPEPL
jgi:hypothetical protein